MSGCPLAPVLTPGSVVVGREQTVVVEFPKSLPSTGLITLAFYVDGSNVQLGSNVPVARLGPCTVKANFPKFSRPGQVDVSVQVMREQKPLFPRFSIQVLSALEAVFSTLCPNKGEIEIGGEEDSSESLGGDSQDSVAILASVLAYLANSDEQTQNTESVDNLLCKAVRSVPPSLLSDWHLGPLLSGRFGWDETLLHVCARQRLEETALMLLQPHYVEGKAFFLLKKAPYDNKTPLDIARKNGLQRMAGLAEITMGGHKMSSTSKDKRKRKSVARASSIDTNLHLMAQDPDSTPGSPSTGKKKDKGGNKLKKLFGKEKDSKRTPSHQPSSGADYVEGRQPNKDDVSQGGSPQVTPYSTLPRSQQNQPHMSNMVTPQSAPPVSSTAFTPLHSGRAGPNVTDSPEGSLPNTDGKRASLSRDQPLPLPQSLPRDFRQSMTSSLSSCDDSQSGSRVSSKEYDSSLPPRDIVRPMAEGGLMSPNSSLMRDQNQAKGEYNDDEQGIYKVPKNVLRIDDSNSEEEEDIYKVPRNIPRPIDAPPIEEDIYKIPKNIPRPVDMDSEEEEDIYKIPKNIPLNRPLEPEESLDQDIYNVPRNWHVDAQVQESPDHDIYNVPRSIMSIDSQPQESPDHEIYNIPKNVERPSLVADSDSDDDDHLYDEVTEELLSDMRRNNLLHGLPEGHYMKVPSRDVLQKHGEGKSPSISSASATAQRSGTGSALLDRLIKRANGEMQSSQQTSKDEDEDEDDGYDYPPSHSNSTLDRKIISLGGGGSSMSADTPFTQDYSNGDEECTENIYDEPADLYQRYCDSIKKDDTSVVCDDGVSNGATATPAPPSGQLGVNHRLEQEVSVNSVPASIVEPDSDSEEQRGFAEKVRAKKAHYQKITYISPKNGSGKGDGIHSSSPSGGIATATKQSHLVPPPSPPLEHKQQTSFPAVHTSALSSIDVPPPPSAILEKILPQLSDPSEKNYFPGTSIAKAPPSPPLPPKMSPSPPLSSKMAPSPPLPAKMAPSPPLPAKMAPSPPLPPKMSPSPPPVLRTPPAPPSPPPTLKPPLPPPSEPSVVHDEFSTRTSRSVTVSDIKETLVKKQPPSPTKRPRTNTSILNPGVSSGKPPQAPVPKPRKPKTETLPPSLSPKPQPAFSSSKVRSLDRDSSLETGPILSAFEQKLAAFSSSTPPASPGSAAKKKPPVATPPLKSKANHNQDENAHQSLPPTGRRSSSPSVASSDQLMALSRRSTMTAAVGPKSKGSLETAPKPKRTQNFPLSDLHEQDIEQTNDSHERSVSPAVGPKPGPKPTQSPVPGPKPIHSPVPGPKPARARNPALQGTKPPLTSPKMYPKRSTVTSSNGN